MTKVEKAAPDFQCVGRGRDDAGRLFILMEYDGESVEPLPFETLSEDERCFARLRSAGIPVMTRAAKAAFMSAVEGAPKEITHYVASRTGFHLDNSIFVIPGQVIGETDKPFKVALGHLDSSMFQKYRSMGTFESWASNVLPLCKGNSRLIFSLTWALASPVAAIDPEAIRGGGFEFSGDPEKGKTTGGRVAGSAWGHHLGENAERGFCETWNTTVGEVERTLAAHSAIGLIIDETALFDGNHAQALMRLAEGESKRRMTTDGRSLSQAFFLSTSNTTVWERVGSLKALDATVSRCLNIPLPANAFGLFEDLHGFASGGELSKAIKMACRSNFGVAGPKFVTALVGYLREDRNEVLSLIKRRRDRFMTVCRKQTAELGLRIFERPLDRLATCYAAGRLAFDYGVLPWKRDVIMDALLSCHIDALKQLPAEIWPQGTAKSVADNDGAMGRLRTYVQAHMESFQEAGPDRDDDDFGGAPGYVARFDKKNWVYLDQKKFKQIVGGAKHAKELLNSLSEQGLADSSSEGLTVQRPFCRGEGNKGWRRIIAIRRKAFIGVEFPK